MQIIGGDDQVSVDSYHLSQFHSLNPSLVQSQDKDLLKKHERSVSSSLDADGVG